MGEEEGTWMILRPAGDLFSPFLYRACSVKINKYTITKRQEQLTTT